MKRSRPRRLRVYCRQDLVISIVANMRRIVLSIIVLGCALVQCENFTKVIGSESSGCYNINDTACFSCTVTDNSQYEGTVWSGTTFNCPNAEYSITNNRIYLSHTDFTTGAFGTCNNGTITGEGASGVQTRNLYTSILTISPVTLDMNGQTISCSLSGSTVIGMEVLRVGAIPEPPPSTSLTFPIPSQEFTVTWTTPLAVIGGVGGFLTNTSGDCGQCSDLGVVGPNTTEVSCSGWEPTGQTCNITVHTVTADCQFLSMEPALATVHLELPPIPRGTRFLATYNLDGSLKLINVIFPPNQDLIDDNGFPVVNVINYTHSSRTEPIEISVFDCYTNLSCTHTFETDHVGGEYFVKVGAQTPIGKVIQPDSEALTIGTVNTFVHVTADVLQSYTIINCLFFMEYDYLSCHVEYGLNCDTLPTRKERSVSNSSDVSVLLPIVPLVDSSVCFIVTASNQSHTVKVQGNVRGYMAESSTLLVTTSIVMTVTVVMALVSLTALTASVIICCKRPRSREATAEAHSVYYSSIAGGGPETTDPNYEEISNVKAREIVTEPNESYNPVSVEPNEAYQINTSITAT